MTDRPTLDEIESLVSNDGTRVSRRLYYDPTLYQLEQERIFGRTWLYLCHTSQVSEPGDFFQTWMGSDNVIVVRDQGGKLRAFLNTCRHRGLRICRDDWGTTKTFTCPYHGWSYNTSGELAGVPERQQNYGDSLEVERLGLIEVPQVADYGGLVYGNFDAGTASLDDFIGDYRFYLDSCFNRTAAGMEVLGFVHRWRVQTNWKMPIENMIGDVYHANYAHGSMLKLQAMMGGAAAEASKEIRDFGYNVATPNGHGCITRFYPEGDNDPRHLPVEAPLLEDPEVRDYLEAQQAETVERLGSACARLKVSAASMFPNFGYLGSVHSVRVFHPLGPTECEVMSWLFVDCDAPAAYRTALRGLYQLTFGPAGVFEQDDGENWEEVCKGARLRHARDYPFEFSMGMGKEGPHPELPGAVADTWTEHPQRAMYLRWRTLMSEA